jgi:hypothetical protein
MRRTIAASVAAVAVVGALAVAIGWPRVERRVLEALREQISRQVDADVSWEDANLSLVRPFPSVGVQLDGLVVENRGPFDGVELARVRTVSVAIDAWGLLSGDYDVRSVTLAEPDIHVVIDEQGRKNYDVFASSGGSAMEMRLERVVADGGHLLYEDHGGDVVVEATGVEHRSKGDLTAKTLTLDSETSVDALTMHRGEVAWLKERPWAADLEARYDRTSGRVDVPEGRITVGELPLDVMGAVWPVDGGYATDLQFRAADDAFGPLLSLVPAEYAGSLRDLDTSGKLALEGSAKGEYLGEKGSWPAFTVDLDVRDGAFERPGSPGVSDVDGRVTLRHAQGPLATTTVDAPSLQFSTAGHRMEGALNVADLFGDPDVRARAKGRVDLAAVDAAMPQDDTKMAGLADVDLTVAGRWSDLEAQNPDRIAVSGTIAARDGRYESPEIGVPVEIDALAMTLGPRSSKLEQARLRFGDSDLTASGTLEGVIGYALGDGKLGGVLDVRSNKLDVSALSGDTAGTEAPTRGADTAVAQVPDNLALTLRGDVGEAVWKGLVFDDVRGTVALKNGVARLDGVRAGLKGGTISASGTYAAKTPDAADVDLDVKLAGFEVGDALQSFPSLGRLVPYLASATGGFDATMAIDTRLAADGAPILETFTSKGTVVTKGIQAEPDFLGPVAQQLSNSRFQTLQLANTTLRYDTKDGRLRVQPFDAKIGGAEAKLGGSIGLLDKSLDLDVTMEAPKAWVQGSPFAAMAPGNEPLAFTIDVKGTWEQPRVGIDAKSTVQDVIDRQIDEQLKDKFPKDKLPKEIRRGIRDVTKELDLPIP